MKNIHESARLRPPRRRPTSVLTLLGVAVLSIAVLGAAACSSTESRRVATQPPAPAPSPDPAPQPEPDPSPPAPAAGEGTEAPAPEAAESAPPAPATAPADRNELPAVNVVDVASGESLLLSSLAPADRPILVWFWAPH